MRALLAALLATTAACVAAAEPGLRELMHALAQVSSARARFVEVRHTDLLRAPLELKGTLRYDRPDRLERRVQSPYEEFTRIEGDRITIERPARQQRRAQSLAAAPLAGVLVDSLRATLAGDLAALERHHRIAYTARAEAWELRLQPRDPFVSGAVGELRLSGTGAQLRRIEIDERSGDRVVTTLVPEPGRP